MSFIYFEGTKDFLAATPALTTTFEASGSITAGRLLIFNSATDQRVCQPGSTYQGGAIPAGLALATVANGDACPVGVWGYFKNIETSGTAVTYLTQPIAISGSGWAFNSGSVKGIGHVGKAISGSATKCIAFINCMF